MSDNTIQTGFENDPELLRIAKALSDGQPVDWAEDVDAAGEGSDKRRLLRRLRLLQDVADAHRRVLQESGKDPDP